MTAVVVTLTFGILIMGMPLSITPAEVPHLLLLLFLGGIATLALGVLLASITLTTAFHGLSIPDGVGGVLFLVSGAVFSFDILPGWVNSISRVLPWTYWLEGIRRIIVDRPFIASLQGLSDTDVMLMLVYGTVGAVAAAWATLRICTHAAISSGGLDMKTDH
jgi:ABC-2 type transport system permease protein